MCNQNSHTLGGVAVYGSSQINLSKLEKICLDETRHLFSGMRVSYAILCGRGAKMVSAILKLDMKNIAEEPLRLMAVQLITPPFLIIFSLYPFCLS